MSTVSEVEPAAATASPEPAPGGAGGSPWAARLNRAIGIVGFVVALLLAALSALFEALLTPLYWGETRFPLALPLAVLGNAALAWFTVTVTGRRLAAAGPAVVWTALMVVASSRTTEGDLVLTGNNWVGVATMLVGTVTFGVAGFLLVRAGVWPAEAGPVPPA